MKKKFMTKALSLLVTVIMVVGMFPLFATADEPDNRVADISTMDNWKTFFGTDVKSTENAGGVWTDKSVFLNADQFPDTVKMLDDKNNFLVALSAIASNKEIVGYATIPTDTVLVLDLSGSISDSADELVIATNRAIESLLDTNKNNRVGVVMYSGNTDFGTTSYSQGTKVLLPIDRYTTAETARVNLGTNRNPNWITYNRYIDLDDSTVEINSTVKNSANAKPTVASKSVEGGTYIQSGLFAGLRLFETADVTVDGNFQDGQKRLPILVLMSDGDPTTATSRFAAVDQIYQKQVANPDFDRRKPESASNPRYIYVDTDESDAGRGSGTTPAMGFLTQLTASYVRNRIEHHYNCEGSSLFYTLGLGVDGSGDNEVTVAETVLDPEQTTSTIDGYWNTYMALRDTQSMELTVPSTTSSNSTKTVAVYKNANAVNRNYVDEYFEAANSNDMLNAFQKIVEEIIIQSRYYATDLEGGNPDFSGYLTFEDYIGEYMEVKDIKGVLIGDTLFSGAALTSKINSSEDGLGAIENPTELGDEFIRAVTTRLGITDVKEAQNLVAQAWAHGQLAYSNDNGEETFSNYIGWYSRADGSFAGFWHEGVTTAPSDAVYTNKSYGLLGQADGNIKDSDMMFMSIQVHTDIESGMQRVMWKIPAALMPMVTYKVTVQGNSIETATESQLEIIDASPVRLLFEVGLREDINELSVANIIDPKFIGNDGVTRHFWSNYWDRMGSTDPNGYRSTISYFQPSDQNERYFYTEDAKIFAKSGNDYTTVTDEDYSFDAEGEYYHARWIFTSADRPTRLYERISKESLEKRVYEDGEWIIPLGTIYRYYTPYQLHKTDNKTESIEYRNYPHITAHEDHLDVTSTLGNNGRLSVTPAQGIRLSKSVDITVPGATNLFKFRITLEAPSGETLEDEYPVTVAKFGEVVGEKSTVEVKNSTIEIDLEAGQSVYITGLTSGTKYTVEELESNPDYKVKSVHVNGVNVYGDIAVGSITDYSIDAVDFLNTPTSEGNLIISKSVTHSYGEDYQIPDSLRFTARVTLSNSRESVANKTYNLVAESGRSNVTTNADGQFTVELKAGESVAIEDIPEDTHYTIEEINIPDGFTLDIDSSVNVIGQINADSNVVAQLVNRYQADSVSPKVDITVSKELVGRDWMNDTFSFTLSRIDMLSTASYVEIGSGVISAEGEQLTLDLDDEVYDKVGTYHYVITEAKGPNGNGITYDAVERRIHVEVTDLDMDGKLEISSVTNVNATIVSGNATDGWEIAAEFRNSYAPIKGSSVTIAVDKQMAGNNFALNGFKFALYDEEETSVIYESTLTDSNGRATFNIAYPADMAGTTVKYILREIYTGVSGMVYDPAVYDVEVRIVDNGDGTTSAFATIAPQGTTDYVAIPTFTNTYDPENGEFIIAGKKNLAGRVQNAGEFTFNLYKTESANTDIKDAQLIDTATNSATGDFVFDLLTFAQPGDYYFAIAEAKGNAGGVAYDETVHRILVEVDDIGGKLIATLAQAPQGGIVFNNTYSVQAIQMPLGGIKHLAGRPIEDGEFTFELKDAAGNVIDTVSNKGSRFDFDPIEYTKAGEYSYIVSEVIGSKKGVAYDKSQYNIKVVVIDNGEGKLLHTVAITKNELSVTGMTFNNIYTPASTPINIVGHKYLTGRDINSEAEFKFDLINVGSATVVDTANCDVTGNIRFKPFIAHAAGVYRFRVVEQDTMLPGITYDTSTYDMTIEVYDNLDGQLVADYENASITKAGQEVQLIEFNNSYKAAPTGLTLEGKKYLDGRNIRNGEFSFILKDSEGNPVESVHNVGNTVTFSEITFSDVGVYVYTVYEDDGDALDGVTYDKTVYEVTVVVTDNLEGDLIADTTIKVVDGDESDIEFNNLFTPADIQVKLNIKKLLENKSNKQLGLDGFKFKVVGEQLDETLVSDKNGLAELILNLSADQIGKTLTFKITEVNTALDYMVYDTAEHTVTVTVEVDNNGVLSTKLTQNGEETDAILAEFTNTYEGEPVPEAPKTGDHRNVWMWAALLFVFGGIAIAAGIKKSKTR